jgi:glycerol-3-phosphate dehydrogenase
MAMSLEDVLTRRLHVHLRSRVWTVEMAQRVAQLMAKPLAWDAARVAAEMAAYASVFEARQAVAASAASSAER